MTNYVVLRRSPDWLSFDISQTRQFCRDLGLRETSIIDYAALWDADLDLSFLAYRQAMKDIALFGAAAVRHAEVVDHRALPAITIADDDLLYFTDDDDWVAPDLFERLQSQPLAEDGWIWRSLAVAKPFNEEHSETVVFSRPVSSAIFTNNYAVTGRAIHRLGVRALLEHYDAEQVRNAELFSPDPLHEDLSAANKHMCCTTFITRPQRGGGQLPSPRAGLSSYQSDIAKSCVSDEHGWLRPFLEAVSRINASALGATLEASRF